MTEPTPEDCYKFAGTFRRWMELRAKYVKEQGYSAPLTLENIATEMYKSRLFYWLLRGNEPLELQPPLYMSGPQHEVAASPVGMIQWATLHAPRLGSEKGPYDLYWEFWPGWKVIETVDHMEGEEPIITLGYEPDGIYAKYPNVTKAVPLATDFIVEMPGRLTGRWAIRERREPWASYNSDRGKMESPIRQCWRLERLTT